MFVTRAVTAAVALAIFAGALFLLPRPLWALFLALALVIGAWEWGALVRYSAPVRSAFVLFLAASALALYYMLGDSSESSRRIAMPVYVVSCVFWIVVAPLWLAKRWMVANPLVLGAVGWIALVPMWLALVQLQVTPLALLLFIAVVWIADTAAYLAGKKWGRRKLAPAISPGKTWEGALGALAGVAFFYGLLLLATSRDERYFTGPYGLALFLAILVLSVEGDLFESLMKRQAGVKDSGHLLPGHGGILDRVDGLTATMPLAALAFLMR